jgi:hypothetical protein
MRTKEPSHFSILEERRKSLAEFGDFLVEVIEGGFERFFVIRIRGVCEIVGDADSRELQIFDGLFAVTLFSALFVPVGWCFNEFGVSHLSFHVFAFPTSGHDLLSHRR